MVQESSYVILCILFKSIIYSKEGQYTLNDPLIKFCSWACHWIYIFDCMIELDDINAKLHFNM